VRILSIMSEEESHEESHLSREHSIKGKKPKVEHSWLSFLNSQV
jgi:hypothetical protein